MRMNVDKLLSPNLERIFDIIESNNFSVRFVGGCVRDLLNDVVPHDIDLATSALPEELIQIFELTNIKIIKTGFHHGTITLVAADELYEITTLRVDEITDGRHAKVKFTTDWEQDATRRDLTINAMSMDRFGKVFDYFEGLADIAENVVRFVGDAEERVKEDYLRILRWFRFIGKAHNSAATMSNYRAIRRNLSGLRNISAERIKYEMFNIFQTKDAYGALNLMKEMSVFEHIGINIYDVEAMSEQIQSGPLFVLATNLNDAESVIALRESWKLSNDETEILLFLVEHKHNEFTLKQMKTSIAMGSVKQYLFVNLMIFQKRWVMANEIDEWCVPEFPIKAKDLFDLGLLKGPIIGKTIRDLTIEWAENDFELTKNELLKGI